MAKLNSLAVMASDIGHVLPIIRTQVIATVHGISAIEAACYQSEVGNRIVRFVAIDVIDLTRRPFPVNYEPRKPVLKVSDVRNRNLTISVSADKSGASPYLDPSTLHFPNEGPGLGVIRKKRSYELGGKIGPVWGTLHAALSVDAFIAHSDAGAVLPTPRRASVRTMYVFEGNFPALFHMEMAEGLLPVMPSRPLLPPRASKTSATVWSVSRLMMSRVIPHFLN